MLILFDIDGTLIRTQGAGMRAFEDAGRELFGPRFSAAGVDFAGSLDPVILSKMLLAAGLDASPDHIAAVRARYPDHLRRHLAFRPAHPRGSTTPDTSGSLPGVLALLESLRRTRAHWTLGLLTGNYEEGARLKLTHCAIDHDAFPIRVYGDDSPHPEPRRDHLPPVARDRHRALSGTHAPWRHVLIIGDTAHDVACARAHGARSLAVATGGSTRERLEATGADLVLEDLSDTPTILKWIDAIFQQEGHGPGDRHAT